MSNSSSVIRGVPVSYSILLVLFFASPTADKRLATDVFKYTNEFRKSKRLPALIMKNDLNAIAQKHSENMARGRYGFGHTNYYERQRQVQKLFHPFYGMAENVAYGANNAKQAVAMWKNSSGHRKNMLGDYKYTGIGTARDRHGVIYYTQIFVE